MKSAHFSCCRLATPALLAFAILVAAETKPSPPRTTSQAKERTRRPAEARQEAIRLNNLGVAYMNQQRSQQALELFEKAYALDPAFLTARLNQGIALLSLQRHGLAREVLLDVTRREPKGPRGWYNLGLLFKGLGQSKPALDAFRQAANLDPKDADSLYFLGMIYAQLQQYSEAIADFERAIALNPFHASAEFGLARAYQHAGDAEKARAHLARFQKLSQEKLGFPMSLNYGDQGRYSLAEQVSPPGGVVPAAIPVRFVSVADAAGIRFEHAGGRGPDAVNGPPETAAAFLGSGACWFDYDGDGLPDLFLVNSGKDAASALYRNAGGGRFVDVTRAAHLDVRGYGMACTAGDYDNDGHVDLAISYVGRVALYRNQGDGTFRDVTQQAGIHTDGFPVGLTFVDYDHDGDLDLYVTRFVNFPWREGGQPFEPPPGSAPTSNVLWRNNGNGTFTDVTQASGVAGAAPSLAVVATDFNNDRAVDFVVTRAGKAPTVFVNPREGQFRAIEPWAAPLPAPTVGVLAFDFDKDGWMDLVFTHAGPPGLTLWRNIEGKRFEPVALPKLDWTRAWGVVALDYDNDGWIDIAAVGESARGGEIRLLRNRGPAGFEDVTSTVGLDAVTLKNPRAIVAADYDRDGDTDLLVTQNGGPAVLLRNDGGNKNAWLRVSLTGRADNKTAVGTKVELYAGTLRQKWEVQAASGYLGQSALEITAGLDGEREADILRLLWPTGVLQDEVQLAARGSPAITEIDRRGSSCPILFAWDGSRYAFVADVIGAGIVGHWVAPGERNISDPTEYLKLDGSRIRARNARLSFRLAEPMEELDYVDQVRLLAVDHPADVEVYPNERFSSAPPFPEFKVIASRRAHPPLGAWDDRGRDVLPLLLRRDRHYVTGFPLQPFKGFAQLHSLELDLGEWDAAQPLRLLLDGYIEYFTATSLYAAHQAGVEAVPPYVEALDPTGQWRRVVDDMGFPAGLARTMVAHLTGRLPAGTRRIRIVTNLQIYWDRVLVDNTCGDVPFRLTEVPLARAHLAFRGYPRAVEGSTPGDLSYIYEQVSPTGPFALHVGNYTRYGDVRNLLSAADDRFVIFGSGEEIALEFDPARLPPLPSDWKRDYFFFADGFAKDMDFYEAHADTVEPLPFHHMPGYPYAAPAGYPEDEAHRRYRLEDNTRAVTNQPPRVYRFRYPAVRH